MLAGVDGKASSRQLVEHNLLGTVQLLETCKRWGAGFVLLSTSRVYSIPPLAALPKKLAALRFALEAGGTRLTYAYDSKHEKPDVAKLLAAVSAAKLSYSDLSTQQSSLEDIFLGLVKQ